MGEFLVRCQVRCHCPDAGVSVGIDLVHFWTARGSGCLAEWSYMVTRLIPGVHPNGVALTLLTSVYLAYIEHGNLVPVLARRQLNESLVKQVQQLQDRYNQNCFNYQCT